VQDYLDEVQESSPYTGDILGVSLSKVMLAECIIRSLDPKDLTSIDSNILAILKTADELAFK